MPAKSRWRTLQLALARTRVRRISAVTLPSGSKVQGREFSNLEILSFSEENGDEKAKRDRSHSGGSVNAVCSAYITSAIAGQRSVIVRRQGASPYRAPPNAR